MPCATTFSSWSGPTEVVTAGFGVAEAHESVTLGATKTAVNAVGVEITWVLALIVVLKNDPPDVKAERLNVYTPAVTPVEVAVFPVIERLGTPGELDKEKVDPAVACVQLKLIVEPVDTAVKLAGVDTI